MPELELTALQERLATRRPDAPCVITDSKVISWQMMTDRSRQFAHFLRSRGLGVRERPVISRALESGQDHVGLCLRNCPEYLEIVLGAHKARAAPFNINYQYAGGELVRLLRDARPAALVFHAEFAATIEHAARQLKRRPLLLQVDDGDRGHLGTDAESYHEAIAGFPVTPVEPAPSPDDLHILYTGGTTGSPRGVLWRTGDYTAGPLGVRRKDGTRIDSIEEALRRAEALGGRVLPCPPFMHGAGLWAALGGWSSGATVVLPAKAGRFDPAEALNACARHEVSTMTFVGDAFAGPLVEELQQHPRALPALRVMLNSGAPLRAELVDRLHRLLGTGTRVIDTLGSSETGQQATRSGTGRFTARGRTIVLDQARARPLHPGASEIGWLAQGGFIPLGYLGDEAKTRETFLELDGTRYAVPGDRARLLADGSIQLLGRDATSINTGGEKVFAEEIEEVLRGLPEVDDALVLGRPSARWGSEVVALITPATRETIDETRLRAACQQHLAAYKCPKTFTPVQEIKRHPSGKPDYAWARTIVSGASPPVS